MMIDCRGPFVRFDSPWYWAVRRAVVVGSAASEGVPRGTLSHARCIHDLFSDRKGGIHRGWEFAETRRRNGNAPGTDKPEGATS